MIDKEYDKLLKKLQYQNPAHDILPVVIELGSSFIAVEYLKLAIAEPVTQTAEELTLAMLHTQKRTLYSRRAVLSNKFHDCTNQKERAEVSIAIGSLQTEIIENKKHLEHYATTGKLPKRPEKLVMPFSGERKRMKLHSVRTSICRYEGLIRKSTDPDKTKDYESKLARLLEQRTELSA